MVLRITVKTHTHTYQERDKCRHTCIFNIEIRLSVNLHMSLISLLNDDVFEHCHQQQWTCRYLLTNTNNCVHVNIKVNWSNCVWTLAEYMLGRLCDCMCVRESEGRERVRERERERERTTDCK